MKLMSWACPPSPDHAVWNTIAVTMEKPASAKAAVRVMDHARSPVPRRRERDAQVPKAHAVPGVQLRDLAEATALDDLITRDPRLHSERPVISGTATTVRAIASMYKQGLTPEEITGELPLNLAQVYAALAYYHLHTAEIEADIAADSEEVLMAKYGDRING